MMCFCLFCIIFNGFGFSSMRATKSVAYGLFCGVFGVFLLFIECLLFG